MKTVICIEGADGSGKSTLAKLLIGECESRGLRWQLIGRKAEDSSPDIAKITSLSQELDKGAPPEAGFHLRIAREHLRAEECRRSDADIVILDRFILSVLSRVRTDGTDAEPYIGHLKAVMRQADLAATVFCQCPFEVAWRRVNDEVKSGGRASLSPKEAKGEQYLRRLHDAMKNDFEMLTWLGDKYSISTNLGLAQLRFSIIALAEAVFPSEQERS